MHTTLVDQPLVNHRHDLGTGGGLVGLEVAPAVWEAGETGETGEHNQASFKGSGNGFFGVAGQLIRIGKAVEQGNGSGFEAQTTGEGEQDLEAQHGLKGLEASGFGSRQEAPPHGQDDRLPCPKVIGNIGEGRGGFLGAGLEGAGEQGGVFGAVDGAIGLETAVGKALDKVAAGQGANKDF